MRLSTKKRRQELRFGQAVLLGVRITCEAKNHWYAALPLGEGERLTTITGPWGKRWQAVNAALDRLEVFR